MRSSQNVFNTQRLCARLSSEMSTECTKLVMFATTPAKHVAPTAPATTANHVSETVDGATSP